MNGIIEFFIKKPKVVNIIMILLLLIGINSIRTIQREGYPSVDFGVAVVTTVFPGASPEDVEISVTRKVEDTLKGIEGIDSFSSTSMESVSQIGVYFEQGTDYDKTINTIQKRINQINDFPSDVEIPIVQEISNDQIPTMEIAITGPADYEKKREVAKALEKRIRRIKEVSDIQKFGFLDREVHVKVNQEKMNAEYIALNQVSQAIFLQNQRIGAGTMRSQKEKKVLFLSEFEEVLDVKDVIIRSGFQNNKVKISDIATVESTYSRPDLLYLANGEELINLIVFKKNNADIINLANSVKEELDIFTPSLDEDIKVDVLFDYSENAEGLIQLVVNNAIIGLILVLLTLFILLNFKVAFWTALGIPLSILFAFLFFPSLEVRINFISLMSFIIVLGLLVDDAIVIAENIFSYREKGLSPIDASIQGTKEVMWPVITTVLTTIVAFAPLIAMSGVMGEFMWQMPVVVTFVLLGSLVESLFILPSHIAHSKFKKINREKSFIFTLGNYYEKFVYKCLKYRWLTVLAFIIMLIVAIALLVTSMKFVLFSTDEGDFLFIKFEKPIGTPLEETAESAKAFYPIIDEYLGSQVLSYMTTIGEQNPKIEESGGNSQSESLGNIIIFMKSESERTQSTAKTLKSIKEKAMAIPGFEKIEIDQVSEGPPVGRAVTITVVSDNDALRTTIAKDLKSFLADQTSVSRIQDNEGIGKNTLEIRIDKELASRLLINFNELGNMIRSIYSGDIVTNITKDGERYEYRVMMDETGQSSINSLLNSNVLNANQKLIPLKKIVQIKEVPDVAKVNHYKGTRSISIYADNDNEIITPLELNENIRQYLKHYTDDNIDVEIIFGGEEKATQESLQSLMIAMVLALLGIYFILVILFNSFGQPFVVMTAIPFTFSGIVYTFFLHGMDFGFMAMIGLIGLTGIVVNDALIMISMLNRCRDEQGTDLKSLSVAARRRFRPILLTTITTAAGLFPSAYGLGGTNAFLKPMILSIAWGLVFATIITLLLVPALYKIQLGFSGQGFLGYKRLYKFFKKIGSNKS